MKKQESGFFKADATITRKVERLKTHTNKMGRGDFLSHEDIERVIGEVRYEGHWPAVLDRFRRNLLRDRGIALHSEWGDGYWLATAQQQIVDQSLIRSRRVIGQERRNLKTLAAINAADLDEHQQNARAQMLEGCQKAYLRARQFLRLKRKIFITMKGAQLKAPERQSHRKRAQARRRRGRQAPATAMQVAAM